MSYPFQMRAKKSFEEVLRFVWFSFNPVQFTNLIFHFLTKAALSVLTVQSEITHWTRLAGAP